MTVQELISHLEAFDPDATVVIHGEQESVLLVEHVRWQPDPGVVVIE